MSAQVLRDATVCHICGGALDFDAPPKTRFAPSVDHIVPISATRGFDAETQRRMALDRANLRPAHYGCNASRGAGRVKRGRVTSREW